MTRVPPSIHRPTLLRGSGAIGRSAGIFAAALIVVSLASSGALAQKKYKYETDPVRLGMKAIDNGDLAEAKAYFDEAIANEHRVPDAHRGLGEILLLQERYDEAVKEFRTATSAEKPVAEAFAGLGIIHLRREETAEAEADFQQALAVDGNLWRAQYGLGLIALGRGDVAAAESYIEKGKKKKGVEDGEHLYNRARALLLVAQGKPDEAEAFALKAMDLAPTNPDVIVTVGEVYEKRGVRALAISKFEEIVENPTFLGNKAPLYFRLGVLYENEKRFTDAVESFKQAVAADSLLGPAYLHAGVIYATAKQWEAAVKIFRQYTQVAPEDPDGHWRLADAIVRFGVSGLDSLAYAEAKTATALAPRNELARLALARAAARVRDRAEEALELYASFQKEALEPLDFLNLGALYTQNTDFRDLERARENLDVARDRDSTLTEVYSRLGVLDLIEGDYEAAEENFTIATRVRPNSVQDMINLGQAKLQIGSREKDKAAAKFAEAEALFRKASEMAPQIADPLVLLAQVQAFRERYEEALATYGKAIEIDPKNASALGGRGFIYLRDEDFAAAERDLKGATESRPDSDRYWAFLGQALHFQGKLLEARSAYDRALALNPNNGDAQEGKKALSAPAGQ